jgi:hypothetical protein
MDINNIKYIDLEDDIQQNNLEVFKKIIINKILIIGDDENINKIINEIINKNMILQRILTSKCLKNDCNTIPYYGGFCLVHFSQDSFNKDLEDFVNECKNNYKIMNKVVNKIVKRLIEYKITFHKLYKYYIKVNKINSEIENINFTCETDILDYEKYNDILDDKKCIDIITKLYDSDEIKINCLNYIYHFYKYYAIHTQFLSKLLYNIRNNNIISRTIYIGNNHVLLHEICKSKIINNIIINKDEFNININGMILRVDLYLMLKVDDKIFEVIIECDEKHHHKILSDGYKTDCYKDNLFVTKDIGYIRIDIDGKIKDNDIKLILFLLEYMIQIKKPIRYFNEKYVQFKKGNILKKKLYMKKLLYEFNKISHISEFKNINSYIKNLDLNIVYNKYEEIKNNVEIRENNILLIDPEYSSIKINKNLYIQNDRGIKVKLDNNKIESSDEDNYTPKIGLAKDDIKLKISDISFGSSKKK